MLQPEPTCAMISQLEAELAERRVDSPVEPELPVPSPNSSFATR